MSGYAPQFCIFHFAFLITERFVMERAEKSIEINAPVKVVFDLYSDFEKWPEWMRLRFREPNPYFSTSRAASVQ